MLTTTILGEAIGVQHGGIQDRTSSNTVQGITHGLIIGKFKRGRTDQPMRINKDTIKARLGYEPNNPFYQVVQDCVDRFPSVWVLRVSKGENVNSPVGQISCDGATDNMYFSQLNGDWDVYVDGVFYPSSYDPAATIRENLSGVIHAENDGFSDFWNLTNVPHRFRFVPKQNDDGMASYALRPDNANQSFMELEDGSIVFCLAPAQV